MGDSINNSPIMNEDHLDLVEKRRLHLQQSIAEKMKVIEAEKTELQELEVTKRTLLRLAGGGADASSASYGATAAQPGRGKPEGIPTWRAMIIEALEEAQSRGDGGLEPKEIKAYIRRKYWAGMKGDQVNSNAHRMYKETHELGKIGSRYVLAKKDKPAGDTSVEDTPTGLFSNPEHDREAGQGGGT